MYTPGKDGKLVDMSDKATPLSYFTRPGTLFSGGGGLVSTAPDYLRFAQMLLDRGQLGGVRVLKAETVDAMLTRQTTAEQGDVYWYAPDMFPTVKGFGWGLSIGVRPDNAGPEVPGRPGEKAGPGSPTRCSSSTPANAWSRWRCRSTSGRTPGTSITRSATACTRRSRGRSRERGRYPLGQGVASPFKG